MIPETLIARAPDLLHRLTLELNSERGGYRRKVGLLAAWRGRRATPKHDLWQADIEPLRDLLYAHGYLVWGALIKANRHIYDHSCQEDHMGTVVLFPDPRVPLEVVCDAADWIRALREGPVDLDIPQAFYDIVRDNQSQAREWPVPTSITGPEREAIYSELIFERDALPQGFLASPVFPLLICPEITELPILLHQAFWPEDLIDHWRSQAPGALLAQPAPERELTIDELLQGGEQAIAERDWHCALFFSSSVLIHEPTHRQARDQIARIAAQADDPIGALPQDEPNTYYISTEAARVLLLEHLGRVDEALEALGTLIDASRDPRYAAWLADWFADIEHVAGIDASMLARCMTAVAGAIPGDHVDDPAIAAVLEHLVEPLELAVSALDDSALSSTSALVMRKIGRLEHASTWAERAWAREPSYRSAMALGLVRRTLGDNEGFVAMFHHALEFAPDDIGVRLDLGDHHCEAGQHQEGYRYYRQALELEPETSWATAALVYYAIVEASDPDERGARTQALWELVERESHDAVHFFFDKLPHAAPPYQHTLPPPGEALVNLLNHASREDTSVGAPVSASLSAAESASIMYISRVINEAGEVRVLSPSTPSPQEPHGLVERQLWRFEGTDVYPNVRPPGSAIAGMVNRIASLPYRAAWWRHQAAQVPVPPTPEILDELFGAMAHLIEPPEQFSNLPPWEWLYRAQHAACAIISVLDAGAPWPSSLRRAGLIDLMRGPLDWASGAAAIMATELALGLAPDHPARVEILVELRALYAFVPQPGSAHHLAPVSHCLLRFDELDDATRDALHLDDAHER